MKKTRKKPKTPAKKAKVLQVTCRFMEAGDIKGVALAHSEAFDVAMSRAEDAAREHSGEKKDHGAAVALVNKTIVGYAFFAVDGDKDMYISNVGVLKRYRGKGVCGSMIPWLLDRLACYDAVTASLYVVSDTDAAIRCYKRHGFKGEGDSSSLTYKPRKRKKCPTDNVTFVCATGDCH